MYLYLYYYLLLSVLAAALTAAFVRFALFSGLRHHFVDRLDSRKLHFSPIPRMGGLCIIAAFSVVFTLWNRVLTNACVIPSAGLGKASGLPFPGGPLFDAVALSAAALFALGFFDDSSFVRVRVRHKLAVELSLAVIIVLLFGIPLSHPVILSVPVPAWIVTPLAVLWLVGLMNAINIVDGVDGLAGSLAVISFIGLLIFAAQLKETALMGLCLVLAGGTAGFLAFNFSPARIFLGDTGSLFLGAMLGTLTLYGATASTRTFSKPVLFLLVAVPVIDVLVAIVRRYLKALDRGKGPVGSLGAVTVADNNHIHHRLIMRGFSHSQTVLVLCAFSVLLCLGGLLAWYVPVWLKWAVLVYTCACAAFFLVRLNYGARFRRFVPFLANRRPASRKNTRQASRPGRARPVGVIDRAGVVGRCLARAAQDEFVFVNVPEQEQASFAERCAAFVICLPPDADAARGLRHSREIAARHGCPVIVISEKAGPELTVSVPGSAPVCCRKMPVSIPKIIEDLKEICREVTSFDLSNRSSSRPGGRIEMSGEERPGS